MERKGEQEGRLMTRTRTARERKGRRQRNISYGSKDNLLEVRLEAALRGRKLRAGMER